MTHTVAVCALNNPRGFDGFFSMRSAKFLPRCGVAVSCRRAGRSKGVKKEKHIAKPTLARRWEIFDSAQRGDGRCQIHLRGPDRAALSREAHGDAAVRPDSAAAS